MNEQTPTPITDDLRNLVRSLYKEGCISGDTMGELLAESARVEQVERQIAEAHAVLDADPSKIIRNTRDGILPQRECRDLSLAERVKSLCDYAANWKRCYFEAKDELTKNQNTETK